MPGRCCLERLGGYDQANEEENGQNRHQRYNRQEEGYQTQEADQSYRDACGKRVAYAPAYGLPAGVANVDGWREGATERRAHYRADTVGHQDTSQIVVISSSGRA